MSAIWQECRSAVAKRQGNGHVVSPQGPCVNCGSNCVHCGSNKHDLSTCPEITDEQLAKIFVQLGEADYEDEGAVLFQRERDEQQKDARGTTGGLRASRLYLDTCTTNNQCVNKAYLTGIHTIEKPLTMHTNASSSLSNQKGKLGSILFWLNPGGLASMVSLRTLENLFHVYYDSKQDRGASICESPGGKVKFL